MRRNLSFSLFAASLAAVLLSGCGGSSGASSVASAPTTAQFGTVSANAVLTQDPVVVSTSLVTAYGIVGNITDLTYNNQNPDEDDTQIAWREGDYLTFYDVDGGDSFRFYLNQQDSNIAFDRNGNFYTLLAAANGASTPRRFARLNYVNRQPTVLNSNAFAYTRISVDGTKAVYATANNLYISELDGTGQTFVTAYSGVNAGAYVNAENYTFDTSTTVNFIYPGGSMGTPGGIGRLSEDANRRSFLFFDSGVSRYIIRYFNNSVLKSYDSGATLLAHDISPSGRYLVTGSAGDIRIFDTRTETSNIIERFAEPSSLAFGYLPRAIKYIGSVSQILGSGSGAVFGMRNGSPRGVVVWDTATRSTSRLRADSASGSVDTIVYTAEGDQIKNVKIVNDRRGFTIPVSVVTATNSLTILVDGATGKIASVIAATVTRSKPEITRDGKSSVTVKTSDAQVFDAAGNQIATNAREVSLVNGKLSVR